MLYPIPTWLRNTLLLVLLFLLLLGVQQAGEAPIRSVVDLSDALGRLGVPPRDGTPFVVPASGPVILDGRKVYCPFTRSYFVWMGISGNGEQIIISREGASRNRIFVGSSQATRNGWRVLGVTGIKGIDEPAVQVQRWPEKLIDWTTHELKGWD
jgi:hypothetical protein